MFEKFKKVLQVGAVASVGVAAGVGLEWLTGESSPQQIENVATTYYEVLPGEKVVLDLSKELPSYRWQDVDSGKVYAGVYCGILGSNNGEIDSKNPIVSYGKVGVKEIPIQIPTPGAEYDGSSGYGYFIVCGREGVFTEKGIEKEGGVSKPDFSKRIVYLVAPHSKKEERTSFYIK